MEVWPGGSLIRAKEIAQIKIANISELADISDYIVEAQETGDAVLGIPQSLKTVTIEGHPRRQSVFALLKAVFNKLGG